MAITAAPTAWIKRAIFVVAVGLGLWFLFRFMRPMLGDARSPGFGTASRRHYDLVLGGFLATTLLWIWGWYAVLFGRESTGDWQSINGRGNQFFKGVGMVMLATLLGYAVWEANGHYLKL